MATSSLPNYSVAIAFEFSNVTYYNKLIDFADRSIDAGLYVYTGIFSFFGANTTGTTPVLANTPIAIVLTRTSTGVVNFYLNGEETPSISFTDTYDYFAIETSLNFFLDDTRNSSNEFSPSGSVSRIMIWDHALNSEEVATAFQAIPEPTALSLLIGAGAVSALLHIRRKRYT